jgi:hypothetical protein
VPGSSFQSIGNPDASAIDLRKIARSNLTNEIYIWDPTLAGNFGVGGYRTLTLNAARDNFLVTPSGGIYPGPVVDTIQSGQAFIVKSNGVGASSLKIGEDSKVGGSNLVNRLPSGRDEGSQLSVNLFSKLPNGHIELMDGAMAMFDEGYSASVNWEDGIKFNNSGETVAFSRNGKSLSVERRTPPSNSDTLYLDLLRAKTSHYSWQFMPNHVAKAGLTAWVLDQFTNTKTPLDLQETSVLDFTVSSDEASRKANRFKIIFQQAVITAPMFDFASASVNRNADHLVDINWSVINEEAISYYVVESGKDTQHFSELGRVAALNNGKYMRTGLPSGSADHYYRIRAVSKSSTI